jgi:integrase
MGATVRLKGGQYYLFISYRRGGVLQRRAKLVGKGPKARKTATASALQINAALSRGDMTALAPPAPPSVTFEQYAERWLAEVIAPHRKARTEDYYRQMLINHLKPAFGKVPLADIRPADVRALIAEKLSGAACARHESPAVGCSACVQPLARNTVKNMAATLRAILYQAEQTDELISRNPAARFGKLLGGRHDPREHVQVLDASDVARVLTAAMKWYPDHELLVALLFQTGMREGEALGLQWTDFDWQRNLVDLRRTVAVRKGRLVVNAPKSGKLRTVDLPSGLCVRVKELRSVQETQAAVEGKPLGPWVFPALTDADKPLNASWFWRHVWEPLLRKAEIRHVRVHDARHTYASLMLRRGVPVPYASRQLGHSSINVTVDLYGHFIPGEDRHHVEGLADAIEAAAKATMCNQVQPLSWSAGPAAL